MTNQKIALITGANKGIGREIARQLGARGMKVLIGARDEGRGSETAAQLAQEGIDARAVRLDVTDQASIDDAAQQIAEEFGRLDVLVNNAGIAIDGGPASTTDLQARLTWKRCARLMKQTSSGFSPSPKPCCRCCGSPRRAVSSISRADWDRSLRTATRTGASPVSNPWPTTLLKPR